jgi:predicted Zn-dependent protease
VKTKRIIGVCLLLAGAVVLLLMQRRLVTTRITPDPLFYLVADTERELERMPLALTRISEQEENRIGEELARSYGLAPVRGDREAQQIAAYVQQVGQRLAAGVKRKGIRYRIFFRNDGAFVNAGALPGGQIVIGRGLLALCETEDELASILGHEIAHVDERHAIERLQYELKSKELGVRGLYRLAQLGVILYQAGYTKEKEAEADRAGLALAVEAGYSPQGAIDVMRRFETLYGRPERVATSPVEEILQLPGRSLGAYFRSHPPPHERIATFEKEISARGWNAQQAQKPLAVRPIFLIEQAERFDDRGLYDRAAEVYRKVLAQNPKQAQAWSGLARTLWRSGDAAGTVVSAERFLRLEPNDADIWHLFARALAVIDRRTAASQFGEMLAGVQITNAASQRGALVDSYGLQWLAGDERDSFKNYQTLLATDLGAEERAKLRARMAKWMYRAGKLERALDELDAARQTYPQGAFVYLQRAWVQSELGLQADALASLNRSKSDSVTDSDLVVESLILWRTGKTDEAKNTFRAALEKDPVWLQARWVEFNFNRPTADILHKLQDAELARRKLEAIRAGRKP